MTSTSPMSPMNQAQREDLQRDVHASLEARRELGPSYDEHFAQQLTERMMAQVRQEMARLPKPAKPHSSNRPDRSQRTAIAICSLIFSIPLVAIATYMLGSEGLIAIIVLVAIINIASAL